MKKKKKRLRSMSSKEKILKAVKDTGHRKEIRLVSKLRNNRLMSIRETMGMSQVEFSETLGIRSATYSAMEGLKFKPLKKNGTWAKAATYIASKLKLPEEYIWPEELSLIENTKVERELEIRDMLVLASGGQTTPEISATKNLLSNAVSKMLMTLTPAEEYVLRRRFGFPTADGEGGGGGVTN